MSKARKLPALSTQTKLLSFDLEANGLHGPAFAVGAALMGHDGKIYDEFVGRCEIVGGVDDWVRKHVLPVIDDIPAGYKNYAELREAFWQWYLQAEPQADYVLVNNGYPVEYRFLLECQDTDIETRYWQHPFPILDLTSLLIQVGIKEHGMEQFKDQGFRPHHPLDDAKTAILTAFKAFEQAGRITV